MPSPTEIVQAAYACFGRGDVPALLNHLTDDVQWTHHGSLDLPYLGSFHGKPAVAQWFGQVAEHDGIQVFEPREFLAGADHVTVLGWERTQALPGGGVFESHWVHVFKLRNGLISAFVGSYDTAAVAKARASIPARR
jgi:ketosteroid isomerase-like protein